MLTKILIGLAALLVLLVLLGVMVAMRPNDFRVSRSIFIMECPSAVFPNVNELMKWEAWSPWEKLDPAMKKSYEGPAVGAGSNTITENQANERIGMRLDFLRPFKGTNAVEFKFMPQGGGTQVTWTMEGKLNFITKAFGLFVSMDKMVGKDFEKGLAAFKAVTEGPGKG